MVKNKYKNNSSESRGFQGIIKKLGQLRCYCLDYWEKQTGTKKYTCGASGCSNSDLVGAHVQKVNSSDKSWYITPLCKACNQRTDEFDVFWDLVPVPSNL